MRYGATLSPTLDRGLQRGAQAFGSEEMCDNYLVYNIEKVKENVASARRL